MGQIRIRSCRRYAGGKEMKITFNGILPSEKIDALMAIIEDKP